MTPSYPTHAPVPTLPPYPTPPLQFPPLQMDGRTLVPAQANNCLVFPGLGAGCVASGAGRVTEGMLLAAARAVAGEAWEDVEEAGRAVWYEHMVLRSLPSPSACVM